MDSSPPRHSVAIFGAGRVGHALSLEMPGVPIIRRGDDPRIIVDLALIAWPAQAIREFAMHHPVAAKRARKVAFSNGAWACEDGADEVGICTARLLSIGDQAPTNRKCWRVGDPRTARTLSFLGLNVACSRADHLGYVWEKTLYIVPLALACEVADCDARRAPSTTEYAIYYHEVRKQAVGVIGEDAVKHRERRVSFLIERSPRGWRPSSSRDELDYFRRKLGCAD